MTDWSFLGIPATILAVGVVWALHKYVDYKYGGRKFEEDE